MYEAESDAVIDSTFGAIAARAARYPVIVKRSQPRPIQREPLSTPATGDPGIRWLLINTQQVNRFLKGTVLEPAT